MTTPEQYKRISELLQAAMELPADSQAAYLDDACAGDAVLRAEVESLLVHDRDEAGALAEGGLGIGAELVSGAVGDESAFAAGGAPVRVGQYRVERLIAEGGMGSVLLAWQDNPRRSVALKLMRAGRDTQAMLRRFRQESHLLGQLRHAGIACVYESGVADVEFPDGRVDQRPYFAMEYVDGEELLEHARRNQLTMRQRLELMANICDAVQYAHDKGVIHRDLKPSNILVDTSGQPKVLDFGVARVVDRDLLITTMETDAGQLIGTLAFMSPEQVRADALQIDARSDVYSLGVVLYELLAGRSPYDIKGKPLPEGMRIICDQEATSLSTIDRTFRGDVETLVGKALQKDRARRYESAAQLAADIRRYLVNEPIIARPPSAVYLLGKFARRHRGLVAGVVGMFVFLIAGLAGTSWFAWQATIQRNEAARERDVARREARRVFALNAFLIDDLFGPADARSGLPADRTALDVLRDATAKLKGAFTDDPDIELTIRVALGKIVGSLGDYKSAEVHFRRALDLSVALYGETGAETITPRSGLALAVLENDRFDEARTLLEDQLKIPQRRPDSDPLSIAGTLSDLGKVAYRNDRLADAESLYRRAQDTLKTAGLQRSDLHFEILGGVASVLDTRGQVNDSVALLREVLANRIERFGMNSVDTAMSMHHLGSTLTRLGALEEADRLLQDALAIRQQLLGESHPDIADTLERLGRLHLKQGDPKGAREFAERALAMQRQLLPENHNSIASTLDTLAVAAVAMGDFAADEKYRREAAEINAATLGPHSRSAAINLANVGASLMRQGKFDEAAEVHLRALELLRAAFPPDHPAPLTYEMSLGMCLTRAGRYEQAQTHLRRAYANLKRVGHPSAPQADAALEDLYKAWQRPDLLSQWRELQSATNPAGD